MRIRTLAAAALFSTAALFPFATAAVADEDHGCGPLRAGAPGRAEAELNRPHCPSDKDKDKPAHHARPDGDRDKHARDCDVKIRDRVRNLDLDRLREQIGNGDWPKGWPEDWKRDWKDCDASDRTHDSDDSDSKHKEKSRADHDSDASDSDDGDKSDDGDDGDDSDDDDSKSSTQVTIVPKGSVDTGDGSAR